MSKRRKDFENVIKDEGDAPEIKLDLSADDSPALSIQDILHRTEPAADPELPEVSAPPEEPEVPVAPEAIDAPEAPVAPEEPEAVAEAQPEEPRSEFESSLDGFTAADAEPAMPRRSNRGRIMRGITLGFFGLVFAICIGYLANNMYDKYKSDRFYAEIQEQYGGDAFDIDGSDDGRDGIVNLLAADALPAYTPTMSEIIANGDTEATTETTHTVELEKMRAALTSLANVNPDIYGWIKIPGTNIDYPVAQYTDNDYYLDHAYNGNYSVNGSIYADFRCTDNGTTNKNTVLYGHNITSGSMFHGVEDFFNREIFDNSKIYLYTMEGVFIYEAFSIHEANYDSGYIDTYFPDSETFLTFIQNLRSLSDLAPKDGTELTADSNIITLSTCTNGLRTRRYALHGVLVSIITE